LHMLQPVQSASNLGLRSLRHGAVELSELL
jgi:hypothetical protein